MNRIVVMTDDTFVQITALLKKRPALLAAVTAGANGFQPSTPEQRAAAREAHGSEEVEIDENAGISDPEDGSGYWVQAWVWVDTETA